jgi:hypothetical protein
MESQEKDKMQKLAGIKTKPAKPTHKAMYNGEVIYKYANGAIKVHGMDFKSVDSAKSYIDHISR